MRKSKWVVLLGLALACAAQASQSLLFNEDFESGLSSRWKPIKFSGETQYTVLREGTNSFLQGKAQSSATGLGVELKEIEANDAIISWKWKIDKIPPGGSDDKKSTFDHTARLFVAFKTLFGPPRSINYVWANRVAAGKTFHHPSSGRSRFIALESGNDKAGRWILEKRDIMKDWKTLFGDDEPPPIVGIGFMTDSDGTESSVTGCYDEIEVQRTGTEK